MPKPSRSAVWTDSDRLCDQCGASLARQDDWLCSQCRNAIEANWRQLTGSDSRRISALSPREAPSESRAH